MASIALHACKQKTVRTGDARHVPPYACSHDLSNLHDTELVSQAAAIERISNSTQNYRLRTTGSNYTHNYFHGNQEKVEKHPATISAVPRLRTVTRKFQHSWLVPICNNKCAITSRIWHLVIPVAYRRLLENPILSRKTLFAFSITFLIRHLSVSGTPARLSRLIGLYTGLAYVL